MPAKKPAKRKAKEKAKPANMSLSLFTKSSIIVLALTIISIIIAALLVPEERKENHRTEVFLSESQGTSFEEGKPLPIAFTIRNLEGQQILYSYEIRSGAQLVSGQALVGNAESRIVSNELVLSEPGEQLVSITVYSPVRNYELWFWAEEATR